MVLTGKHQDPHPVARKKVLWTNLRASKGLSAAVLCLLISASEPRTLSLVLTSAASTPHAVFHPYCVNESGKIRSRKKIVKVLTWRGKSDASESFMVWAAKKQRHFIFYSASWTSILPNYKQAWLKSSLLFPARKTLATALNVTSNITFGAWPQTQQIMFT